MRTYSEAIWNALGLNTYIYLIDLGNGSILDDEVYQKVFCGFYKVRRNKDNWIKPYFEIFKDAYKNKKHLNTQSFQKYFDMVQQRCVHGGKNQEEASFVSKMLHTIKPSFFPIFDSRVKKALSIPENVKNIEAYKIMCKKYKNMIASSDFKKEKKAILSLLSKYKKTNKLSNYKILDILHYF